MDEKQDNVGIAVHKNSKSIKSHSTAHHLIFGFVGLLILFASGYGVYAWQHNKVVSLVKQNASLANTSSSLRRQLQKYSTPTPLMETDTLDNGTQISYPLTSSNANVIWWSQNYYNQSSNNTPPDGIMVLSDKRIIQFLSLIPFDILRPICGNSSFSSDIAIQEFAYNPISKVATGNQYGNCITLVADGSTKYAAQGKAVLSQSEADMGAFEKSLIVKVK